MFTGIVEEIGVISIINESTGIDIRASVVSENTKIGDSIAVNGVCLTVRDIKGGILTMDVMPETIRSTALTTLKKGSNVNLERALLNEGRFGGHIVTGHIDAVGKVIERKIEKQALWLGIKIPDMKYVVLKGSIALDGVSLTISGLKNTMVWVSLIPHTSAATILSERRPGDLVNVEYDILAKYNSPQQDARTTITMKTLEENGF